MQEKWDSMTRKWRDYKSLVQLVRLFLIDEVHQLNDETRGPTMEAIVSRMKTIRSSLSWSEAGEGCKLRFIAISATMPNISDVSALNSFIILPSMFFPSLSLLLLLLLLPPSLSFSHSTLEPAILHSPYTHIHHRLQHG